VAADPGPFPLEYVSTVALLLGDFGLTEPVTRLREHCVDRERARGRTVNLAITLQNLAEAYRTAGETERALRAGREAGKIYHDLGDAEGEATLLFNEAFCLARLGQRGEAWAVLDRMKALSREAGSDRALGMCLNLRGRMRCHATPEDRTAAENDMRAAEGIARAQGDTGALATSLFGQGMIRLYERDLSGARERYAEALRLFRSIGRDGEADHAATRLELVERFASRPRVASAIGGDELWHPFYTAVLLEEGETAVAVLDSIDAEGDRRGELQLQAAALVHRAALARLVHEAGWRKFLGPAVQILSRYEESEAIELMRAVGTSLLTRCAASEVALAFFAEVERSARAHRRRRELAQALLEQGVILANEGNLAAALKKFEEQGRIARKAENWESLAHALNNQAAVLEQLGRPALSVGRLRELLPVLRRLGDGDRINEVSRVLAMISQHYRL